MANVTLYSGLNAWSLADLERLDLDAVTSPSLSPSSITGYIGDFFVRITGTFSYSAGTLTGGTFTGITISYSGAPLVAVSGVSLDVETVASASLAEMTRLAFDGPDVLQSAWASGESYALLGGDDRISLGVGDDRVDGGSGTDTFVLGTAFEPGKIKLVGEAVVIESVKGKDSLIDVEIVEFAGTKLSLQVGSSGDDTLIGDANAGILGDFLYGRGGDDRIAGGFGNDRLFGHAGADELHGDRGADRLFGGGGGDLLDGGRDNDLLSGQRGRDVLLGRAGDDVLRGGGGGDVLRGGAGDDVLTGGAGPDAFLFGKGHGDDRIADFTIGTDRIDILSGAAGLSDLGFSQKGGDVLISFADVTVLVEDVTVADLRDAGNFDF